MYQLEVVWNREFEFHPFGKPKESLKEAIDMAYGMQSIGDGARVKSTRITDDDGRIVWQYGRMIYDVRLD